MNDERITLETAKLAKKKRFDVAVFGSYVEYLKDQIDPEYPEGGGPFSMVKGEIEENNDYFKNGDKKYHDYSNKNYSCYARPTQALLARWIREIHEIHIEIYCNASGWGWILTKLNGTTIKGIEDDVFFKTAEIACEKGLKIALNMILPL
jgi:hypothetical protein